MVYELERVLRVCDDFFCSMSVKNNGAVLLLLKSRQTVTLSPLPRGQIS